MGIDFSRKAPEAPAAPAPAPAAAAAQQVEAYDIVADRKSMDLALTGSPEIDRLVSQVQLDDMDTIVHFGAEAAEVSGREGRGAVVQYALA